MKTQEAKNRRCCIVCGKPLEYRHGLCYHKCDPKFIARHEAGIKIDPLNYDNRSNPPYGVKLSVGFAILRAGHRNN